MTNSKGLTIIELIIVVAIIGILVGISSIGVNFIQTQRIEQTAQELYADLYKIRQQSMTQGDAVTGIQISGIRFVSTTSYTIFNFNDIDNDFIYDATPVREEADTISRNLSSSIELKISAALNDPNNDILIYDNLGLPRDGNWNLVSYVLIVRLQNENLEDKCITLGMNKIRKGIWDGNSCQEQ